MANKRHTPEQVINKLRSAEVAISAGRTVSEASRQIGITEPGLLQVAQRIRRPKDRLGQASQTA